MVAMIDTGPRAARRMDLAEYMEFVEREVDVDDFDNVVEGAWALRALANDRNFVIDNYHKELKTYWEGYSDNENLPQSVLLAVNRDFYVRTNIWLPVKGTDANADFQRSLYSYDMAHDHNFHFVTVGYFGPGYETDLYRYDQSRVQGYEGELVDLEERGRERLTAGRTMVYEAGRDVHVQHSPEAVSVSLNLMCRPKELASTPQYIFDPREKRIVKGAGDLVSTRLFLLDLCRHLHDEETVNILSDFVADRRCERTRAHALHILRDICPDDMEYFERRATAGTVALSSRSLARGSGTRDHAMA